MALVGDLKELTLADIIQINCLGRNTARLLVHYPIGDGIFFFQDGEVFHATLGELTGVQAVFEALKYTEGAFRIDAMIPAPTRSITRAWADLLMDGMRQIDEEAYGKEFDPYQSMGSFSPEEILARRTTQNIPIVGNKDQVGAIINDKYRLDKKIKDGELGTMYRATHIQMDVPVAIKVLHSFLVNDEAAIERFRRGAHAAAKIRHPNAITVSDFGATKDGVVYMAMEFLTGETLRERIDKHKRLSAADCAKILKQVASALEAAHRQEIIHRDLKPENIMFDDANGEETVKVLDFGLAKLKALGGVEGVLTAHGVMLGTHDYMSPEVCEGSEVDRRSDIYSLGIVIYETLTGRPPFIEPTPVGVALKHIGAKPDSLRKYCPDISESVDKAVLHALEKSPADRPQTALEFALEFERALSTKPSSINMPRTKVSPNRFETIPPNGPFATRGMPEIAAGELGEAPTKTPPFDRIFNQPDKPANGSLKTTPIAPRVTPLPPPILSVPPPPSKPVQKPSSSTSHMGANPDTQGLIKGNANADTRAISNSNKKLSAATTVMPVTSSDIKPVPESEGLLAKIANSNLALFFISIVVVGILLFGVLFLLQYFTGETPKQGNSTVPTKTIPEALNEYILIAGGSFKMGRDEGPGVSLNETPAHDVKIASFYIGRYEVTNKEYQQFVTKTKWRPPAGWNGAKYPNDKGDLPVTNVTWRDAMQYCTWLSGEKAEPYRLPTEEEWEFAARSGTNLVTPLPNKTPPSKDLTDIAPLPVTNQDLLLADRSKSGAIGMAGNVSEWTASLYQAYPDARPGKDKCIDCRVVRGGNYRAFPESPYTFRNGSKESFADERIGFRIARDAKDEK